MRRSARSAPPAHYQPEFQPNLLSSGAKSAAFGPLPILLRRSSTPRRNGVANDGDEVAMPTRLYAQHAEAVLGIVERHPLDSAGEHFAVRLGCGGRRRRRLMISYVRG
jgi:hypothetical protein